MPKNRIVKFRVSSQQYEKILNNKQVRGYVTIASFLRDLALEKNFFIEEKLIENNKMTKEILDLLKNGKEPK